jgi:hypothetical protein
MTPPTDIDYGPLTGLIGTWRGDKGMDIAPEPDGIEENPYYETITFEAAGDVTNAESQVLAVVRYHQLVSRKSNNQVFHDESGYWMWDAQQGLIMQSLVIPRAVCVLAGARYEEAGEDDKIELIVGAKGGDPDWGILQSPFMRDYARTVEFRHRISIGGDILEYSETTVLDIYGQVFDHIDSNELTRKEV